MVNSAKDKARGGRIREIRIKRGLTQAELAEKCDVHLSFISAVERGESRPGRDVLFKLAGVLRVSSQYIETGALQPEDQAKKSRFELWPWIVYVIVNHVLIPRLQFHKRVPGASVLGKETTYVTREGNTRIYVATELDDPDLSVLIDEATRTVHFCDYYRWARSDDGILAAGKIEGRGLLEQLIELGAGPFVARDETWIEVHSAGRMIPEWKRRGIHRHIYSPSFTEKIVEQPYRCLSFDLATAAYSYSALKLGGYGECEAGAFWKRPLRRGFIRAAFPEIFWSAAQGWSEERLLAWIDYLDLASDVWRPLAVLGRSIHRPKEFRDSAQRLIDQADIKDADVFLGMFCDLYGNTSLYNGRYAERPFSTWPAIRGGRSITPGKFPPTQRRREFEMRQAKLLLEAIYMTAEPRDGEAIFELLRTKAPPHQFTDDDVLELLESPGNSQNADGQSDSGKSTPME